MRITSRDTSKVILVCVFETRELSSSDLTRDVIFDESEFSHIEAQKYFLQGDKIPRCGPKLGSSTTLEAVASSTTSEAVGSSTLKDTDDNPINHTVSIKRPKHPDTPKAVSKQNICENSFTLVFTAVLMQIIF